MWGIDAKDVLIFLAGLAVAYYFGRYFLRLGYGRKQIVYSVKVADTIFKSTAHPDKLKITYDGEPISVLTKVEIYIWNGGNQSIAAADLQTDDRLRVEWPGDFRILEQTVRYQTRPTNKVELQGFSELHFAYLNTGDGAIIDVLGSRSSKGALNPTVAGEIIGAPEPPQGEDFEFSVRRGYIPVTLIGFFFAASILFAIYNDRDKFSVTEHGYWYFPFGGALSIMALAAFGVGCLGVYGWITAARVPVNMMVEGQQKLGLRERIKLYLG